jgi:hypothetical protein
MPNRGSVEVGQRRFWNMLRDKPGIMWIGSWGYSPYAILTSDTGFEAPLTIFENGPIEFPPEHKLARTWTLTYSHWVPALQSVDFDGTNEWIFKPFSTEWGLVGPNAWAQGSDWMTANIFIDSSPFVSPTSLHYIATGDTPKDTYIDIAYPWAYNPGTGAQGWGAGGLLYGYLNDHYFGNNEMGGNKPNEGVGPKTEAIGDLSKSYVGLWGAFGISHGTCINNSGCSTNASWTFDLCYRPQMAAYYTFNNQISHLNEDTYQSEGWGTDVVALHENTVEKMDGSQETYRQFSVDVSPAGSTGTMNVYTMKGRQLEYGIDYVHDDCDKSGRSYRLNDTEATTPTDPCEAIYALVVTYLVVAPSLRSGRHPARQTDTNEGHDRLRGSDVRGL